MTVTPLSVVSFAFTALITVDFIRYVRSGQVKRHFMVFVRQKPSTWVLSFFGGIAALTVVLLCAVALMEWIPSVFGWSWLSAIATKSDGPVSGQNLNLSAVKIPWFGILFTLLLALNIPRLARLEEAAFRRGTKGWADAIPRSLKFGFMHMIVGVPLAAGLCLTISGLWFTWNYFWGDVRRSTFAHVIYNYMVLAALAYFLLFS